MSIMNMRLARKAYMFEFIDTITGKNEYFSFAVPPESEDLDFPQRVTETKTIGGSVFDDYGNDTIPIQINGTTINEEKKLIYRGKEGKFVPKYFTGQKEIFELQKLINDWGKGNKIPGKKIYLYDLSKMSLFQMADGNSGTPSRNYWRVVIKKLKIRRGKDKPNTFVYALDMIGMEDTERNLPPLFGEGTTLTKVLNGCQKALEVFQTIFEVTEVIGDALDEATSAIAATKSAFEALSKGGNQLMIIDAVFDKPMRILTGGSSASLFNASKALIASGNKISALVNGTNIESKKSGAQSRGDIYMVIFSNNGGSYVPIQKVAYSQKVKRPENPIKEKYAFENWYKDPEFTTVYDFDTEITENLTLYAKWTQTIAVVTFNSRGGSVIIPQSITIGEKATPPDPPPTRNGYAFEYWCTDITTETEFNFSIPMTGDITLYVRWKIIYTIIFNSNGGSDTPSQIVNVGGKVIYPTIPTRKFYIFGIWCTDPGLKNEYHFNLVVTSGFTLYAKWTQVSNLVAFKPNGGSDVPEQIVLMGGFATKPSPNPTWDGHTFTRWCIDQALANEFFFASTPINYPTTIYAKWVINIQTVTFNSEGGSSVENQSMQYGDLAVYPIIPVKANTFFIKWYYINEDSEHIEYDFSQPVMENIELHAEWYEGS
ncbi:hypothetical protein FACS1894137_05680 [Spirochaetia bacterium]|nr:hypothetical protein FACS1894137_05680 [Spirochaetia bacterium]